MVDSAGVRRSVAADDIAVAVHSQADDFFAATAAGQGAPKKAPHLRVVRPPEPGMMDRRLAIQLLREYYADEPVRPDGQ
jgi:hypothetical protein